MTTGSRHDRKMLILLYKALFISKYPPEEYQIIFEPKHRPIDDLYYIPDILITKDHQILFWIEVGALPYEKATSVINYLGASRFLHIPENHPIFRLELIDDISKLIPDPPPSYTLKPVDNHIDFNNEVRRQESQLYYDALKAAKGNIAIAAENLNMTKRQLRYRLEKYGLAKKEFKRLQKLEELQHKLN